MGSALGGAKAGAVASLFFAGSISLFNILILLIFRTQAVSYLQTFSSCAGNGAADASGTAESCLYVLIVEAIPLIDFVRLAVVGLLFGVAIGVYFDFIPGKTYMRKTLLATLIMLVSMLFLGLTGIETSVVQEILVVCFETAAAIFYALVMARLYRRFTREVEFQTVPPSGKVVVDSRDYTGKKRTFRVNSKHKIEAKGELKSFKGWLVSGGVAVKDPKELRTSMEVTGDGLLKLT